MKIAIIGAGAMGSIYGGKLSSANNVSLIDNNAKVVETINKNGLKLEEDNTVNTYYPKAYTSSKEIKDVDLLIIFVKAIYSKQAIEQNLNLIGDNTLILTLQNGAGHQDLLKNYVSEDRIIIGTTEDVGKVLDFGFVSRSGFGKTNIGMITDTNKAVLTKVQEAFNNSGFNTIIHENINQLIWNKLFINTTLSATTALLQCEIGYLGENEFALQMVEQLLDEAITVAKAMNLDADKKALMQEIKNITINSKNGVTSICADIRNGRKTEVETISGAIVSAAAKLNIEVPTHKFVVKQIHALEK